MKHKLNVGNIGSGGCPCGEVKTEHWEIITHCWRSQCPHGCEYSCVGYKAKRGYTSLARQHAEKIKDHIIDCWSTDCEVHKL